MSEKDFTPEEINRMTDDELANLASDPAMSHTGQKYMQGVLMERYDQHLKAFFPGLT